MRCPECGADNAGEAQVCGRCEAPIAQHASAAADRGAGAASLAAPAAIHASAAQQRSVSAPDSEVDGAILAGWAEATIFSATRLRPGYDQEEVDAFLSAIRDTFLGQREPSLTPDEIRDKRFSTTRLRPGYDEEEVDAFLDEAGLRLAAQAGARCGAPAAYQQRSVAADPAAGAMLIRCLECGAESARATEVCAQCGAPLTGGPAAIAADEPAVQMPEAVLADAKRSRAPQAGFWAMMVGGAALSAFCAYAIVLNVHAFLTQGTPTQVGINYLTPSILAGNIAIWGVGCLVGFAAAIWGFRRCRHSRPDRS